MPKTLAERQADWRDRVLLRSNFFVSSEQQRLTGLRSPLDRDPRPEVKALLAFFRNYPRCFAPPEDIDLETDGAGGSRWLIVLDYYKQTEFEIAAATIAMREVTSLPFSVEAYGDGKGSSGCSDEMIAQVQSEVDEMRRLNIWGA